jgi:serine/alanine adding enzyme
LKLLKDNEISIEKWDRLLSSSPLATPFQNHAFYDLCNAVPGLSAEVFAVEEDFEIIALCVVTLQKESGIKGFFSRRAVVYGGPVIKDINSQGIEFLIRSIEKKFKRKVIYIEIRNLNDYKVYDKIFLDNSWKYLPYQNFKVNCTDRDVFFNRLGNNRKRQIKKAIENGVLIKEAINLEEVTCFYDILQNFYKKKVMKPMLPKQFFEEFFKRSIGKLLLVIYKDKIIGGIMCPILDGRCIYELYICGLDEDYKDQCPSVMATWSAMEYANKNQIPVFDFMGAGRKDQDYGVREFKSRFGGEFVEYGRYIRIFNPFLYKLGECALKMIKKLKK